MSWVPCARTVEGVIALATAHPVPGVAPDFAGWLVQHFVRGPEVVLEHAGTPPALAAVVDTCASVDGAAILELLALGGPLAPDALDALLARAEVLTRGGPRRVLDVPVDEGRGDWLPALAARGYAEAYALHTMVRPAGPALPPRDPLPDGCAWEALALEAFDDYHRVSSAAFARVPGAMIPDREAALRALADAPARPEVLRQDGRVVAFARTALREDGTGEIVALGRDPAWRGRGLGDHLLGRAMDRLVADGAARLELSVAARNASALRLYERHGFAVSSTVRVERRAL